MIQTGSQNPGLVLSAIICGGFYALKIFADAIGHSWFGYVLMAMIGFVIVQAAAGAFRQWRLDRELDLIIRPTYAYGSAFIAGEDHIREFDLAGPLDGSRIFLGAIGNTILSYGGISHLSTIAPNNSGKSESVSLVNCLILKHNLLVTDKGGELAIRSYKHRRDRLNQEVVVINPWHLWKELDLPNHHFNILQPLVKLAEKNDPEIVDEARAIAQVLIPDSNSSSENPYFNQAARSIAVWAIVYYAFWEATTGELTSNFPHLYSSIASSVEDLEKLLRDMRVSDFGDGVVRMAEGRISSQLKGNAKTFQSVLSVIQNGVDIFDPFGMLGRSMEYSDFDPDDLKRKGMTIYIVVPSDKMTGPYGKWVGLVVDVIIRSILRARKLHPRVTAILDEFANISDGILPSIIPALYVGRSYGCQIWTFVQDRNVYKRYKDEASAFESQSEVVQFWGTRSPDDSKWIEERSGQTSIMTESVNAPNVYEDIMPDGQHSITLTEKGVPVVRKDQALQLPDWKQFILFKNRPIIVADLISFRMMEPIRDWVQKLPEDDLKDDLPVRFNLNEKEN